MGTFALIYLISIFMCSYGIPRTKDVSSNEEEIDLLHNRIDENAELADQRRQIDSFIESEPGTVESELDISQNLKEISFRGKERKGKGKEKQKGKGLGKMFDNPEELPPDTDLENILAGEIVVNGKHRHKPTGSKKGKKKKLEGEDMDMHMEVPAGGKKRNFLQNTSKYWTKGIVPYEIDTAAGYTADEQDKIYGAISQFDNLTCVRWVPRNDPRNTVANLGHSTWIKFVSGSGCKSYVGNVAYSLGTEFQPVTLTRPACMSVATAVHEMLHAIGAHHEQSRADRDKYIEIQYQNMLNSTFSIFKTYETTDLSPYDMESDLQYSLRAFSSNGGQTMKAKDWRLEFLADIADGLMYYDIFDITQAYNCASACAPLNCQNAGFVNWQCRCYCPNVLTGPLCEETVGNCGGIIDVPAGQAVYVTTPNYPNNYDPGLQCTWLVRGDPNNVLRMTIEDMDISDNGIACYHFVEIRYNLLGQTGPKRCGKTAHEIWDASQDEFKYKMIVLFDSFLSSDKPTSRGLKMKFESIGSGCVNNPCKFGVCYSSINTATYTCRCDPGFTGTNCDALSASAAVGCTAEVGEFCMLSQEETTDVFDWDYGMGETPTMYTGPTNAIQGFVYLFTESSSPRVTGDTAVLKTTLDFPSVDRCLRFKYHMYGSGMGTLNVFTSNNAGTTVKVFSKTGHQGNQWLDAEIFIPAMNGLQLKFESIRGSNIASDMAIDDVWLTPGPCVEGPIPICKCSFEQGESRCCFADSVADKFNWIVKSSSPYDVNAGPFSAFQGSSYAYSEVSALGSYGDTSILVSSISFTESQYCLAFAYHMYGNEGTVGSLVVGIGTNSIETVLLSRTGNKGDKWYTAALNFSGRAGLKIFFSASRGFSTSGDIALDNINIFTGTCSDNLDPCYSQPCHGGGICTSNGATFSCTCNKEYLYNDCSLIDKTNTTNFSCDFDGDTSCVFQNVEGDVLDWRLQSGPTPTSGTGPNAALSGKYYMYIEASPPSVLNDYAVLDSSRFKLPANVQCMKFSYHMWGLPGSLAIIAGERSGTSNTLLTINGDHGDKWTKVAVLIPQFNDVVISIKGIVGSSELGDIAIDQITIQPGSCDQCKSLNPCKNGGQCTSKDDGSYTCVCPAGFSGTTCSLIDKSSIYSMSCDFEPGETACLFNDIDGDNFDWTLFSGKTPTSSTGPDDAFSGIYYIYTEASYPRVENDLAIIDTSKYRLPASPFCMQYSYHMYSNPGSLIVKAGDRNTPGTVADSHYGNQEEKWHSRTIQIPYFSDVVISIEGTIGSDSRGDIGLDLIRIQKGLCTDPCGSFPCLNGGECSQQSAGYKCTCKNGYLGAQCQNYAIDKTSETIFTCDFENSESWCIFDDSQNDVFDWTRQSGHSSTSGTGPDAAFSGSYYKYTEASYPRVQYDDAVLDTSKYRIAASTFCLEISHHMYGSPGKFIVSAGERGGTGNIVLSLTGDQGNRWVTDRILIPRYLDTVVTIKGIIGPNSKGDIAIDKLILRKGTC